MGSGNELQNQLELSKRFDYITTESADKIIDEVFQVYKMMLAFTIQ